MKQLHPYAVWLFFFGSLPGSLALIFMLIFGGTMYLTPETGTFDINAFFSRLVSSSILIIILILIFDFVLAKLTYHFYKYELTDMGFRKEHGIIYKKYVTIPYDRIQNVDIYRGIVARILGLSDLQIQTAGGITRGSYGAFSEGRLPGLSKEDAEILRDEVLKRARSQRTNQGL